VEASRKFVCTDHSGFPRSTIQLYHKRGWLKEGALIRDGEGETLNPPDADYFREKVRGYHKQPIRFYLPISLARCVKRGRADRAAKRWQATPETFVARGEDCVRAIYVRRELGIGKSMLQDWDQRGWPVLDGAKPRQGRKGYPLEMVRTAMDKLEQLPSSIPPDHPTLHSIEKTNELTGLSISSLHSKKCRDTHRLVTQPFLVRIDFSTRNGKPRKLLKSIIGFTRDSVSAFLTRKAASDVPADTVKLQALAKRLRAASDRSKITAYTINGWCNEKLLDAVQTDYWTVKGFKRGWIISNESAAEAHSVLRQVGWNVNAATSELRALHKKHVAANGGKRLASFAESRLAESRKAAEDTAQKMLKEVAKPGTVETYPALGIDVDFAKKIVYGRGKAIEFERSHVQWHIFRVALSAFPGTFSLDDLRKDYPGEQDDVARQVATMHLNKKLARLDLRIKNRLLGKKTY
jgi:hypothetical protein